MIVDNVKASYFSPHFWWKSFDRAIEMSTFMNKYLNSEFDFRKWLFESKIEHNTTQICLEEGAYSGINQEYTTAIRNDYYFEVGTKSKYGHPVTAKSIEELYSKSIVKEGSEIYYTFRTEDLHGFAAGYLQKWLLTNTYQDWVKWQLYLDFIIAKTEEPTRGLYIYLWAIVIGQIEFEHHLFKDVAQYKKLRDKKEEFDRLSEPTEKKFIRLRDLNA